MHLYISGDEGIANQISMWQRQKARALRTHLSSIYRKAYKSVFGATAKFLEGSHITWSTQAEGLSGKGRRGSESGPENRHLPELL